MGEHTPGPWRKDSAYYPESGRTESFSPYIVDSSGRNIACAMMIPENEKEFLANRDLIAAAPTLLSVLGCLEESASVGHADDCQGDCQLDRDLKSARALLKDAK